MPAEQTLNAYFDELRERLTDPTTLNPASGDPIFYFVYPPARILTVRRLLPGWIARLRHEHDLHVQTLSLSEIVWELVDASGFWETSIEMESSFEQGQVNESIRDILRQNNALIARVAQAAAGGLPGVVPGKTILFITDVELLHPLFSYPPDGDEPAQQGAPAHCFLLPRPSRGAVRSALS
ncbi:MAG: hypothetical protein IPM76_24035 [Chloroflexi bacterium]|nr:hypothetical protein [Chloroflexota bacterium]